MQDLYLKFDVQGRTLYGKVYRDNIAFLGVTYLENGGENVIRIFRVNDRYLKYKNSWLVDVNASVTKVPFDINLTMPSLPSDMIERDMTGIFMNLFEKLDLGRLPDYTQTLRSISLTFELKLDLEKLTWEFSEPNEPGKTEYDRLALSSWRSG